MDGREFYDDSFLRMRVRRELADGGLAASDYNVDKAIQVGLSAAAAELRDAAGELRECYKPDACRAEAEVLRAVVAWLDTRSGAGQAAKAL